ncbi:hypothetical protein H9L10_05060 [Phycicoccus endophyticus]|uniref:Camelysin metallo-endopeptidase n=1 Tax=Phycicoccus endophyticus TaxID=1690220 RepID=A0A7G9R465_9MICO|nr:TasA family protein [Phycicoccus endophyticus]NHI18238.1 hypothetical protein [Phycicoccus endophyticus]QNN50390.1 hypothetical protein H9L10_05060 [Phycicoccus endophyticus]GGL25274.1 hypothetical protein GCM10012283_04370 [Phycicoccus endophyticus]
MFTPSARLARIAAWGAAPVALLASAGLVATASHSAFSATTSNPTGNWAAGTVELTDDDAGTAAFDVSNMKPGDAGSKCIAVTSTGSLPSAVRLYGTSYETTKDLADELALDVTQGTGGSFGSCDGFTPASSGATVYSGSVADFGSSHTGYSTGVGTWSPAGGEQSRVYKFDLAFDPDAPNSVQGGTASIGFTWEAQNS